MAFELTAAAIELPGLTKTQRLTLIVLAHHCNSKTKYCAPNIARISEFSGMSERQVQREIKSLLKAKIITRVLRKSQPPKYQFPGLYKWVSGCHPNKEGTDSLREEGRLTAKKTIHTREDDSF